MPSVVDSAANDEDDLRLAHVIGRDPDPHRRLPLHVVPVAGTAATPPMCRVPDFTGLRTLTLNEEAFGD